MMTARDIKQPAGSRFFWLVPLLCMVMALVAAPSANAQYSAVPYQDAFDYGDGTDLDGVNGWQIYDGAATYGTLPAQYHGWMPQSGSSATAQSGSAALSGLTLENWFGDYTGNPGTDGEYDKDTVVTIVFELEPPASLVHNPETTEWSKFGNMFATKRWHYENRASYYKMLTSVRWFVKTNGLISAYNGNLRTDLTHTPIAGPTRIAVECDYTNRVWSLTVGTTMVATNFALFKPADKATMLWDGWYKDYDGLKSVRMVAPTTDNTVNIDDFFVSRNAPAAGVLPFAETFDTIMLEGDLHGQNGWYATGTGVDAAAVRTGTYGAAITAPGECFHTFVSGETNVWSDLWLRPLVSGGGDVTVDCGGDDAVFYIVGTNPGKGNIYAYDGVTVTNVASIDETAWTRFVVHTDYSSGTWDLTIDDVEIVTGLGFKSVVTNDSYQEISISAADTAVTYVDDISIELNHDPYWLPTVNFETTIASNEEEVATAQVNVVLDDVHNDPVTVDVVLLPASTATDPDDVTGTSTNLTFAPGETSKTVTLSIVDDGTYEFSETVVLGLVNEVEAIVGTSSNYTYTILDTVDSAPPAFLSDPVVELDATQDVAYVSSILDDASDPDGDPLSFTKIGGPDWLTVAADGTLGGTPLNGDVGTNLFTVVVTAVGGVDTSTLQIAVLNVNDAPTWHTDPVLEVQATEGDAYSSTLADDATDADIGAELTFDYVSGPIWLNVASNGVLSGTPVDGNAGTNSFAVSVSDGVAAPVQVELLIPVAPIAPTGVVATAGDTQVDLTWVAPLAAESFVVSRATISGGPYSVIATPSAANYTDSAVTNSTVYYYTIAAVAEGIEGPASSEASALPLQSLPFSEDFEARTLGLLDGQPSWEATNTVVQSSVAIDTQAGSITSSTGSAKYRFRDDGEVVWTDYVAQPVLGVPEYILPEPDWTTYVAFNTNGNPVVYDGTSQLVLTGTTISTGTWTRITIKSDYTAKMWDLFIDGASVATGLSFYNAAAASFSELGVRLGAEDGMEFDNVGIDYTCPLPPPEIPTNLVAIPDDSLVDLSWDVATGADSYNVKRSISSGSGYVTIASPTATSYSDITVTNDVTYYYVVSAVNIGGESADSTETNATPHLYEPDAPTGLGATPWDGEVTLSWDATDRASGYNIKRALASGGPYSTIGSSTTPDYTDITVTNDTTYYYVVSGTNTTGEGSDSTFVSATPYTPPPSGLAAVAGDGQVTLAWDAAPTADSYNVKRGLAELGPYATIDTSASTNYVDSTVTNDTTYYYKVSAVSTGGESVDTAFASATPTVPVPTGLAATPGDAQVDLAWNPAPGAVNYNVKRALASGGPYTTIASPTAASYNDSTVTNGMTYYYVVSTVSANGESANSGFASATPQVPPPATPTGLAATAGDGVVDLTWDASAGADTYNIKRGLAAGGPFVTIASPATPGYSDTSVTNNGTYYYVVSAENAGGESADSASVSATPVVPVPTGLSATAGDGVVDLAWDAADGALSYNVKRADVSGGPYTTIASEATTGYSDTTVTNNGTYYYVVSTVSANGESVDSTEASATPLIPVPTGLAATPGDGVVDLTWNAADGAINYNVKRALSSGGAYTTIATPATPGYSDTAVTNGTTYYYVVSTVSANGESADSGEVNATPQVPAPPTPTGLSATAGDSTVYLAWNASAGADSYNVKRALVSGGPFATIASPTTTNYTDNAVTNNTTYYYVVSAVNPGGESADSTVVSATPLQMLPFIEDFEPTAISLGTLAGQNGWEGSDAIVQNAFAIDTQAGSITSDTGFASHRFGGRATDVWGDFMIQPVFADPETAIPDVDCTVAFVVNTNGNPVAFDGTNRLALTSVTLTEGSWTRFSVHSDYATKTWDLYVNGLQVAKDLDFYNGEVESYSEFVAVGSDTRLDDLSFGPEVPYGLLDRNATIILVR